MNVNKININQSESSYYIASDIYDVSAHNNGATFASLSELLSAENLSTLIPTAARCSGMSIRFIQSSDNKYVQYRLTADEWSTDTNDWVIYSESVYLENPEFVYVKTDTEGKILLAIKVDGSIYYGAGVPHQVIDYINKKIAEISLDEYEVIVSFLADYLGSDTTLKVMIDGINAAKVDKIEGKSLIDAEYADGVEYDENPEYIEAKSDSENKIVSYRDEKGVLHELAGIESPSLDKIDYQKYLNKKQKLDALENYMVCVLTSASNISTSKAYELIDAMSDAGCTHLCINPAMKLYDASFEVDGKTYNFNDVTYYRTEEDFENIIYYAQNKGISIIPCISFMTHNSYLKSLYPELLYPGTTDSLNINSPHAINVGVAYIEMYVKWLASRNIKYVHISCDEFGGIPSGSGYLTLQENREWGYARFINRCNSMIKSYGLITMMWNDPVCVGGNTLPMIDKDIIICHWTSNISTNSPCTPDITHYNGYILLNSNQKLYWTYNQQTKPTAQTFENFDINNFFYDTIIPYQKGVMFCIWTNGATSAQHEDIIDTTIPLIGAYGEQMNKKIGLEIKNTDI